MLKLKRVEIQGFKSFFDRTEMRFSGAGIAAIVGPNGCGKSNLSDAISWVLGEQSAKTLRGSRMEDVIFAGTRDRKPLGMASVTMTLAGRPVAVKSATNGHVPSVEAGEGPPAQPETSEVTITRRLFRSGDSEYLVDGRTARLRDIQDLFMGSGLGPESYAIIEQGRIGQILSTRPQDRRAVIEEAAGITRFKTRKRLAEAKLEGAKQNLTRVFDILEEVGRQVNSLKRQAAKARRYDELKGEMVGHLRRALTGRFKVLERDATKTALDLNEATSAFRTLSAQVAEQEKNHGELQERCYRTEAELTQARKELADFRLDQERTRGKLDHQAHQAAGIEQRLTQGEAETRDLEQRQTQQREELDLHLVGLAELEHQTESARAKLAAKTADRESIQTALQERARTLETSRQQVLRLLGEASTLNNQLAQIEEFLSSLGRDRARSENEQETANADLERLGVAAGELTGKISAQKAELDSLITRRRGVETELAERKTRSVELRRETDQLRADFSRTKARHDSLEEVIHHRSYTTESVKRLFTAIERGQAPDLTPVGVLADFVEVDPAFEKATEEFLHEELEYVVVEDWQAAERGIDVMRSDVDGRATFLVHPESNGASDEGVVPAETEGVLGRLGDHLRFTNGLTHAPADLLPRLAKCYLAADRGVAQRLSLQFPELYFLLSDGITYQGYAVSGGKKKGSGPLGLKRELRELTRELATRQKKLDETSSLSEQIEREATGLAEELEQVRGLQQAQEREALALEHEQRKVSEELARANSRLTMAAREIERLAREHDRATTQREKNQQLVAEKQTAREVQEQVLEQARADLDEFQAEAARAAEEHAALRADLAGYEERRRAERSAQARLESHLRDIANRRQEISREMERLGVERARLLADNIELDRRGAELAQAIARSEETVEELSTHEAESRSALSQLEEELKQGRFQVAAAQEKRSQIELELVKKEAELKYLDETSRKELNIPVAELAGSEELLLDEAALAEAEQRYQDVRARIEALGPVNPDALQEFEEAQQRHEFLNAQRQDLLDSIHDTEKAIQEIDTESRKRFNEAFGAINSNFREMFTTLFGGGVGEMRLNDEENAAESGIDIVASPPGKKLQSVLLLSGGEKSLTAMALLMAIFQYQPSPFCVLDEIDAPLDEANIERLTRLLKKMSEQTQFIVITHAKRTMEAAQTLYGVTMQEAGISKLVSVRFQPAGPPPATQLPLQEMRM